MVVLQPIKLGREMSRLVLKRGPVRRVLPLGRSNARNNLDLAESLLTISADEFTKKWNFDPVREVPIAGGRYCWRPAASPDPTITTSDPTTEPKDKSAILVSKRARCHCDCGLVPRCCGCDCGSCTCRSSQGCPPSCTAGHTSSGSVMREFGKMVTSVNMTSVRSSLARAADGGVALHTSPTHLEDSVASTTTTKASLTTPETSLATAEAPGTTKGTSVTTTGTSLTTAGTSLTTAGTSVTSTGTSVTTTGTSVTTSEASPTSTGASRTGSSVTTTAVSLITSSGAVTTSGCAVTKSESVTKMLTTTVTAPVKAVTPSGSAVAVTTPSGAVTTPSGAATMPSSKVTSPSTAVTTLSIAVTQSGRAITKPNSAVTGCRDVTLRQTCITEFARPSKRRRLVKFHKGTTLHPPISAIV
ncbi:uncharacterized protein [Panulirus ornatus]|uniref:uncharacterized protein n=1 Tax=Panulirus ornatus TaxID=150431 RepID=UPI003A862590